MLEFEFWKDIGNISDAILNYQKKNAEFNNRYINPWLRLGNLADHVDRSNEIAQAYQHAADIDPHNVQNWIDLADEHLKLCNWEDAVIAYQKALELSPKAGWPMSNLALCLVMLGRVEESIPLYIASIELLNEDKDKAITCNRLGEAYRKLNDYEKAFFSFQKADRFEGKIQSPAASKETVAKEVVDEYPFDEEEEEELDNPLTNFEKMYSQINDYDGARRADDHARPMDEAQFVENGVIPSWLSEEHKSNLHPVADENKNQRVPDWLLINSPSSARGSGEIYISEKDAEAFSDQFNSQTDASVRGQGNIQGIESFPLAEEYPSGDSFLDDSVNLSSELAYEEYLKDVIQPSNILSDHVAEVQNRTPQAKLSKDGEALMALETKNAQVWNELGNNYMKSESYDDAIASYSKAIELERHFAWPYSNLALAYVQKNYFSEAILLYQRSLELFHTDKDKAVTWNRLGNVYRRMNDYSNAMAAYQTADELDPDNATLSLRSSFSLLGNLHADPKPNYVS